MSAAYKIGDRLHRVDGAWRGETVADGFELSWQEWGCFRLTKQGGWFVNLTWPYKKHRFALASGCRWGAPDKAGALRQFLRRKRRHLAILEAQREEVLETQALATEALRELEGGR